MCCVMTVYLLNYIISLTERALARAGQEENPALPSCKDRIPAEHDFCSFPDTRATDNLALPPAFFILEGLTAPKRSAEFQNVHHRCVGRGLFRWRLSSLHCLAASRTSVGSSCGPRFWERKRAYSAQEGGAEVRICRPRFRRRAILRAALRPLLLSGLLVRELRTQACAHQLRPRHFLRFGNQD